MSSIPTLPPAEEVLIPRRGRALVYDSGEPPLGGGGRPILLLHGWTTTAALNWYRCMPGLAERFRTIALDQRGHGRGIRSRLPFRLEDCADDAAALIEHLGVGPCTVVGYSMGGPVAQLVWKRHPEVVEGLVLCATAAKFTSRGQMGETLGRLGAGTSFALSLVPPAIRRSGMTYATARWTASNQSADWAAKEWSRHDPMALIQAGAALWRFDSRSWIDQVDVPTAVVVTEEDRTVSPARQRFLATHIPGAVAVPVAADHRACVDASRIFVPALISAIDGVQRHQPRLV